MRIHLVTDQFNLGGGIEHIYQITKGLKDFSFRVFGLPGPAVEKFHGLDNVEVRDEGFQPADILRGRPDLIHFHHLKPLFTFIRNPLRRRPAPVVFTAHGLHLHKYEFYNSLKGRLSYFLRFYLEKRVLPKADRIIAVSREDKAFLEEKYRLKQVTYLTNGIDFSAVRAGGSKKELRKRLGLPADAFLFVTVARFNFQKGYDVLLKALEGARSAVKKNAAHFAFVGDGPEFEAMKGLSRTLKVNHHISFLGARTDVYDILAAADAFLLPSRWEGLPIVLLETGLLKVPVIASDTYGNREIIGEKNGVLFKNIDIGALTEVIENVLMNKYDLGACAENLYKEIQTHYSLEKMLAGLKDIYSL